MERIKALAWSQELKNFKGMEHCLQSVVKKVNEMTLSYQIM